jgi:catechol 2,3-dioxygenase-like lactoylglutathione lyase family enzyme
MSKQVCDHIGFLTSDSESMKRFYITVLGFELGSESMLAKSLANDIFGISEDCRFIKLHKDGFMIEMFEPISSKFQARVAGQTGINHWGFCVADRILFVERLRGEGVPVIEIDRNGRSAYFTIDPDGNRIEIRDYPG